MALCSCFEAFADEVVIQINAVKQKIDQMIKDKNYDHQILKDQEKIIYSTLDDLIQQVADFPTEVSIRLTLQIRILKDFAVMGFAPINESLNKKKLKNLVIHLEALNLRIRTIPV